MSTSPAGSDNRLLAMLPAEDRDKILAACTEVDLELGITLQEPHEPIHHVYFPTASFISLITPKGAAESLEVGLVGVEGMSGATLLLGVDVSPLKALVQGPGPALKMSARDFQHAFTTLPQLHKTLNAYLFVLMSQIAQTAACSRFHNIESRLARWILLTHDRAGRDEFRLTHEFLAQMLGVRRAGVTEAAGLIQERKLIYYRRGVMQILNRRMLESVACPCYEAGKQVYAKHLDS